MRKSLFYIFLILFIGFTSTLHAEIFNLSEGDVNLDLVPSRPSANQEVTAKLTSYILDLNSSNIIWNLNGKIQASGNGIKDFKFTTGNINTVSNITVTIRTKEGQSVEKKISIKPTDIDLIWQTEGYVPPFYKGKAMFSHQNKITFIATPHMTNSGGAEISPKNLIYKWIKNGQVIEDASGYGKNVYTFASPLISRTLEVSVEVTSPDTNYPGFARTNASPIEPSVILYKKNPLYGIEFQKALVDNVKLSNSREIVVVGIPYFFGVLEPVYSDLNYVWAINGAKISNSNNKNVQVFRHKEGTSGSSNISLSIENTEKMLQYASSKFNLEFEDSGKGNAPSF